VTAEPRGEAGGLATMIGDLIDQNLRRDPSRRHLLRPGRAVLDVPDAAVAVTVSIGPGRVHVRDGPDPRTALRISADGERLMRLASAPLRFGFPDPLTPDGRRVLGDVLAGRVRIRGGVRSVPTLRRLTMLLSAR
jgi:hypothetical protein